MAKELGMREEDNKNLEVSALLHDVGKIGVSRRCSGSTVISRRKSKAK